jgi:hypothetical protein
VGASTEKYAALASSVPQGPGVHAVAGLRVLDGAPAGLAASAMSFSRRGRVSVLTIVLGPAYTGQKLDDQRDVASGGIASRRTAAAIGVTIGTLPGRQSKGGEWGAARSPDAFNMPKLAT